VKTFAGPACIFNGHDTSVVSLQESGRVLKGESPNENQNRIVTKEISNNGEEKRRGVKEGPEWNWLCLHNS